MQDGWREKVVSALKFASQICAIKGIKSGKTRELNETEIEIVARHRR